MAVSCCASPTVRPALFAKSSKNSVALCAAVPNVVPKAAAASSALVAAFTASFEKSNNALPAIKAPPAIAVFCNPERLLPNFLAFFDPSSASSLNNLRPLDTFLNPLAALLTPTKSIIISSVALAIIYSLTFVLRLPLSLL